MSCSIPDDYENFRKNILTSEAKGENQEAQEIVLYPLYYENERMASFDEELKKLTDSVWKTKYLHET